jgi:coenzyme F420 hydrogenase subunit beta
MTKEPIAKSGPVGPALAIYQGHAADPDIRFNSSSGGLLSALALYCLENEEADEVRHVGADPDKPWANRNFISKSRESVLSNCGSRYAPSSPCEMLKDDGDGSSFVFVGKPCDVWATRALANKNPELKKRMTLALTFCCAGVPSTKGTLDLVTLLGMKLEHLVSLRYRGKGWPGNFRIENAGSEVSEMTYQDSWGRLSKYRSLRCICCPDGLGFTSDITCGDAWHDASKAEQQEGGGSSIAVIRTQRGLEIFQKAVDAGYIEAKQIDEQRVVSAQHYLVKKRRELFGRMLIFKLFRVPMTSFIGFHSLKGWLGLPIKAKVRSIGGTLVRVVRRKLWRKSKVG